ncbi:MAG: hypothetical protein ABI859_06745 [Pseudomonadota bacterium]
MSRFRSDCSQCCGLCCVVPAYFSFQGFGADKPAHTPCPKLDHVDRCAIHPMRDAEGYTACARFDCYGAGQWITQTLHPGASWRDSPAMAERLFRAYRTCLPLFELAAMLDAAIPLAKCELQPALRAKRDALVAFCSSEALLQDPSAVAQLKREVRELLSEFKAGGLTQDT